MMDKLFDLSGKVALVTGGSRGLGRAMVMGFAKAGADVVIASRKLEGCKKVAEEVEALGRRAMPVSCHVADWDQIEALVEKTYETFGKLDILVNSERVDALSQLVHRDRARARALHACERLKEEIPRHMFKIPIQGTIGNTIIARSTISPFRGPHFNGTPTEEISRTSSSVFFFLLILTSSAGSTIFGISTLTPLLTRRFLRKRRRYFRSSGGKSLRDTQLLYWVRATSGGERLK